MAIEMTFEERFAAAPERVFETLTDIEGMGRWAPGLVRTEMLTEPPVRVGTEFRETRKLFGREATEQFRVIELEPARTLGLLMDGTKGASRRGEFRFRYTLRPDGDGGTALRLDGSIAGLGRLGELTGRLFLGFMKKGIAKDLAAMRAHLEADRS